MVNELIKKVKLELKIRSGAITRIKREKTINHKWNGNEYGGFFVHPDKLNNNSIVYSFGIGEDISFDQSVIDNYGCNVFAFDPTPKSIEWVKNQQLSPKFTFYPYGIDTKTGFVNFNLPKNENYVSGSVLSHQNVNENNTVSVPMKCFKDITAELGHKHIDVLKVDIEGSEYGVINDILSSDVEIDQLLLEIHERFFDDGKAKTQALLKSLKGHGYSVFAVSDSAEEISFIKKSTAAKA
jgi:FkbM family methyltransferase